MRKNIALVLALVMLLSMIPMVAFASSTNPTTYTTGALQSVATGDTAGTIRVTAKVDKSFNLEPGGVDNITMFVGLPSRVTGDVYVSYQEGFNGTVPSAFEYAGSGRNISVPLRDTTGLNSEDVIFWIDIRNMEVGDNFTGDQVELELEFNKFFRNASLVIANVQDGELAIEMPDVYFISDADLVNDIGSIRLTENITGALTTTSDDIELTLPRAFYWDDRVEDGYVRVRYGAATTGTEVATPVVGTTNVYFVQDLFDYTDNVDNIRGQFRTALIDVSSLVGTVLEDGERSSFDILSASEVQGMIDNGTIADSNAVEGLRIRVDAIRNPERGDVVADVDGAEPGELIIARYGSYVATPEAREVRDLFAGQVGSIGRFEVREDVADSLAARRTITMTLPVGVKWHITPLGVSVDDPTGAAIEDWARWILESLRMDAGAVTGFNQGTLPQLRSESEENGLEFVMEGSDIRWQFVDAERRTIRATIAEESDTTGIREGALLVFNRSQVVVAPDFRGPIEVEMGGSAGAAGTITLAEVYPAVEVEAAAVNNVIVGAQNQPLANITITETFAGAAERTEAMTGLITLRIPQIRNAVFANTPVAEVVEGDMLIERVWMSADRRHVHVQVQGESDEPTSIELSNLALTLDRTAPEGEMHLEITGDALVDNVTWARYNFFESDVLDTVVVANVLDRAPLSGEVEGEGPVVSFTIGQNTYVVDGETMMMDVAPFISNDRTMVPVRYLEELFGVKPVWNAEARTVTVLYEGKVFEMAIGSNVLRVNGAPYMELDASVEIVNERTFVPASRFARAMGIEYDWTAPVATFYGK